MRSWCQTVGAGDTARRLILVEMVARVIKNLVRRRARQLLSEMRLALVEAIRDDLLRCLNTVKQHMFIFIFFLLKNFLKTNPYHYE